MWMCLFKFWKNLSVGAVLLIYIISCLCGNCSVQVPSYEYCQQISKLSTYFSPRPTSYILYCRTISICTNHTSLPELSDYVNTLCITFLHVITRINHNISSTYILPLVHCCLTEFFPIIYLKVIFWVPTTDTCFSDSTLCIIYI